MMNILYVWFPASWGPSVVEAIQKRNETWLAQNPVFRDSQMFNHSEVAGPASCEMTYKIQKWNVLSDRLHSILVANARVDWLALKDDEITQEFPILREGILQDVFSQRAFSAWQGAQHKESQFLFSSQVGVPERFHLSDARFMSFSRTQFWWPWNAFLCRVAVI